jgi:hypothetical protein
MSVTCYRCKAVGGVDLPFDAFPKDKSKASGYKSLCKPCDSAKGREYYEQNREAKIAAVRSYQATQPVAIRYCKCGAVLQSRQRTCAKCQAKRRAVYDYERYTRGPGPTARGYGSEHKKERKRWVPLVATGTVTCARCNELIAADALWDLGHVDGDKSRYQGPEHRRCNRATAGRKRQTSRAW